MSFSCVVCRFRTVHLRCACKWIYKPHIAIQQKASDIGISLLKPISLPICKWIVLVAYSPQHSDAPAVATHRQLLHSNNTSKTCTIVFSLVSPERVPMQIHLPSCHPACSNFITMQLYMWDNSSRKYVHRACDWSCSHITHKTLKLAKR